MHGPILNQANQVQARSGQRTFTALVFGPRRQSKHQICEARRILSAALHTTRRRSGV